VPSSSSLTNRAYKNHGNSAKYPLCDDAGRIPYLHRDHLALQVKVDGAIRLAVPLHNLQAVSLFGNVMVSPGPMELCAEGGVSMTFLSENGRLLARVDGPVSGNVLLRRKQFRQADNVPACAALARNFVAGKIQHCRGNLLRAAKGRHSR
jgi:CRISP-associated protein Cas1